MAELLDHALVPLLESLETDALLTAPRTVIDAADKVLPIILEPGGGLRRNYSFATKFLHWVTRRHFPIVDSRARTAINGWPQGLLIPRQARVTSMAINPYTSDYRRWVTFYSELMNGLTPEQQSALVSADLESQSAASGPVENSLLRVLDKYFYREGGGTGLG